MTGALKHFIKQRLRWADRWLTFRRQIRILPALLEADDEQFVDLLVADLVNWPCLWVLSTHRLYCMEPLHSSKVHIWEGKSQIVIAQNDQMQSVIRLHVMTAPHDPDSVCQVEISYETAERHHAARFVNMINMLSCGHCWGEPHRFEEAMCEVEKAAARGD